MGFFGIVPVADAPKPLWRRREEPFGQAEVEGRGMGRVILTPFDRLRATPIEELVSQGSLEPFHVGIVSPTRRLTRLIVGRALWMAGVVVEVHPPPVRHRRTGHPHQTHQQQTREGGDSPLPVRVHLNLRQPNPFQILFLLTQQDAFDSQAVTIPTVLGLRL
jgi:hypothetical protein